MIIVILGPDGSGKSTIMHRIADFAYQQGYSIHHYHMRPRVRKAGRVGAGNDALTIPKDPHIRKPYGPLLSVVKAVYIVVEIIGGYYLVVRKLRCRDRCLVLFDRYYYDLEVDPLRYRYNGPVWLLSFLGRFIPQPDVCIYLDAPEQVLQSRKPELGLDELCRQRAAYSKILEKIPNAYQVDATRPLDQVVAAVKRILFPGFEIDPVSAPELLHHPKV
jgi:thymidylate kinase